MSKTDFGLGVRLENVVRWGEASDEFEYRLGMGLCWRPIVGVPGTLSAAWASYTSESPSESVEKLAL